MRRNGSGTNGSSLWNVLSRVWGGGAKRSRHSRPTQSRRMRIEALEGRAVLATNLAAISGTIYLDRPPVGFNPGEQVANATVNLFTDDGDGIFEPGAGDTGPTSQLTNVSGKYTFSNLTAGSYWIQQPGQTVGAITLQNQVSSLIVISPAQAQGIAGPSIDQFTNPNPDLLVSGPIGTTQSGFADVPEAIGGERDLFAEITDTGDPSDEVTFRGVTGFLDWSATATAKGRYTAVWDGNDNSATLPPTTNLINVDLTNGGLANAVRMTVQNTDKEGGKAQLRVYTSDVNFSDSLDVDVPLVPVGSQEILFNFADFTATGGVGATLTNVTAIQLTIVANQNSMQGRATLVGGIGPAVTTQDFSNPADLSLTKQVSNASPNVNDNVTFTVTVSNAGPSNATNVAVNDLLPAGLQFVSANAGQGTYNSTTGVWSIGTINANGNATLQIVAKVLTSGLKLNIAEVSASDQVDPDSTPSNGATTEDDRGTASVTPQSIDLSLTKQVNDSTPNVGQNVTFTVTVANAGPSNATGVAVNDQLPAGLTFVSATPSQGTYNNSTGIWTVGQINSAAQATLQIIATVGSIGVKTNTAQVSAADQADIDSTPGNSNSQEDDQASAAVTPDAIDLALTKTVNDSTPDRNQSITFTITVTNSGTIPATGVTVTDVLPAGLTFVSATPSTGTYNNTTGLWTVGSINNGGNASLNIVATVATSDVKVNTAQVSAANEIDIDSTPGNGNAQEDDQASVTVTPNIADLSLTKTVDIASPNRNQNVTFTLTVSNAGPAGATGVNVTDALPAGLTFVSANASQGTYNNSTGLWTIGAIASGANVTLQLVANPASAGTKTNTAQVSAADGFDPDSTPNNNVATEDDQASAAVTPNVADLAVTKTVDVANPIIGQNVTFNVVVTNSGPANATNLTLEDLLPSGLTFVSATPSVGTYNNGTGVWTIGTLNGGSSANIQVVATVTNAGIKTNVAEVAAVDQFDPDSTPDNGATGEDDRASAVVTPQSNFSKRMFLNA